MSQLVFCFCHFLNFVFLGGHKSWTTGILEELSGVCKLYTHTHGGHICGPWIRPKYTKIQVSSVLQNSFTLFAWNLFLNSLQLLLEACRTYAPEPYFRVLFNPKYGQNRSKSRFSFMSQNNYHWIQVRLVLVSLTIVYATVYSGADQRKHQSSASLAFVRGIHRWPVNSPYKWPVTRKMFPFDDVILSPTKVALPLGIWHVILTVVRLICSSIVLLHRPGMVWLKRNPSTIPLGIYPMLKNLIPWIASIFNNSHRSLAAVVPIKYEPDT